MRNLNLGFAVLLSLTCLGLPARSQTALERVLAMVEAKPELFGVNTYINVASHAPSQSTMTDAVDGSVQVTLMSTVPETGQPLNPDVQIETMSLGSTNTGRVRVTSNQMPTGGESVNAIVAVNASTTAAPILAPVSIIGDALMADTSKIATKSIGAMNTGAVQIIIRPGSDG
jgi:hypothetical protein